MLCIFPSSKSVSAGICISKTVHVQLFKNLWSHYHLDYMLCFFYFRNLVQYRFCLAVSHFETADLYWAKKFSHYLLSDKYTEFSFFSDNKHYIYIIKQWLWRKLFVQHKSCLAVNCKILWMLTFGVRAWPTYAVCTESLQGASQVKVY